LTEYWIWLVKRVTIDEIQSKPVAMTSNISILVINCGSSSLKFSLITASGDQLIQGIAEQLGTADAALSFEREGIDRVISISGADHKQVLDAVFGEIKDFAVAAIGHRVVHGGEDFKTAALIDADVLAAIEKNSSLAPLHNPANLVGIKAAQTAYPSLPQVAVFDTAFHQTMPPVAYRYALPEPLYTEQGIRRYGFHGTSHAYVSRRASQLSEAPAPHGWVCAHLGNGASTCAIFDGKSLDTSMGLTPLEGLVMGTRSGSIDPGLIIHLISRLGYSADEVDGLLNKKSGLLGLSGTTNDMRELGELAADPQSQHQTSAQLAIDVFCYKAAQSISAMICALPTFTGLLFTGGIGENAHPIRAQICGHLQHFGLSIDTEANQTRKPAERCISCIDSTRQVWVIPTDEEGQIAFDTRQLI
jgi:acetate kinase